MARLKAIYAFLSSPKTKSQIHALVTAALALYTALKGAGV